MVNKAALFIIFFVLAVPSPSFGGLSYVGLFSKIDQSDYILLGECVSISDEKIEITYPYQPGKKFTGPRYGTYKVIEAWKNYPGDVYYTCDFLPLNQAYEPEAPAYKKPENGRVPYIPSIGEVAYLFIKDGQILDTDYQGYSVESGDEHRVAQVNQAVDTLAILSQLDYLTQIDYLLKIRRGENGFLFLSMHSCFLSIPCQFFLDNLKNIMVNGTLTVKYHALKKVNEIYYTDDFPKLLPFINDPIPEIRIEIAKIIYRNCSSKIDSFLVDNFKVFPDSTKISTLNNFKYKPNLVCLDIVFDAANSSCIDLRVVGISTLQHCPDDKATEIIYNALNDGHPEIIIAGLNAATNHITPPLINYINGLLKNSDTKVKIEAIQTLGAIYRQYKNNQEISAVHQVPKTLIDIARSGDNPEVRLQAIYVLTDINSPALIELFPELVFDNSPIIRANIVSKMGYTGDMQYIPILEILQENETDDLVLFNIQEAIMRLNEISTNQYPLPVSN